MKKAVFIIFFVFIHSFVFSQNQSNVNKWNLSGLPDASWTQASKARIRGFIEQTFDGVMVGDNRFWVSYVYNIIIKHFPHGTDAISTAELQSAIVDAGRQAGREIARQHRSIILKWSPEVDDMVKKSFYTLIQPYDYPEDTKSKVFNCFLEKVKLNFTVGCPFPIPPSSTNEFLKNCLNK